MIWRCRALARNGTMARGAAGSRGTSSQTGSQTASSARAATAPWAGRRAVQARLAHRPARAHALPHNRPTPQPSAPLAGQCIDTRMRAPSSLPAGCPGARCPPTYRCVRCPAAVLLSCLVCALRVHGRQRQRRPGLPTCSTLPCRYPSLTHLSDMSLLICRTMTWPATTALVRGEGCGGAGQAGCAWTRDSRAHHNLRMCLQATCCNVATEGTSSSSQRHVNPSAAHSSPTSSLLLIATQTPSTWARTRRPCAGTSKRNWCTHAPR